MTIIRPETLEDVHSIREVNRLAFSGEDEGRLVDLLRDELVGHILFIDLSILTQSRAVAALALAPLAVTPVHQRRGIGSQLLKEGLSWCRKSGHRIVIVVGHPAFYSRFGFSATLAERLRSPYSGPHFMALELEAGALEGVDGDVSYPPPFQDV
jgi:putative acetyltransferase